MRLSPQQTAIIRQTVDEAFTPVAEVRIFGSRIDDDIRGGDIDLLVETPIDIDHPAFAAARLAALLERRLNDRRVDVVLITPSTPAQTIHRVAREQGIRL